MAHWKRMSDTFIATSGEPPLLANLALQPEAEELLSRWKEVYVQDLIDDRIVSVDAETSVEDACEVLLSENILCLVVKTETPDPETSPYIGLFDFSDVNAFLTLAATNHTLQPEDVRENPRVDQIVTAARAGRVPIKFVSDLSQKNPLRVLPHNANLVSLLEVFAGGTHRVLVSSPPPSVDYLGMVSDRGVLSWFYSHAKETPTLQQFLTNPLNQLSMPSLNIYSSVIAAPATATVLDAMKLMSEQGVSNVAVLDDETGTLLSAVSVTDIGKIIVPSESNHILSTPLHQFVSYIKAPEGSTDGAEKYPVYSVFPTSTLSYTIEKLLATNAHRLFVVRDSSGSSSPMLSPNTPGNLSGIASVVDILSLFAHLAKIPNVDPTRMQRHRRASWAPPKDRDDERSRSNSRTRINSPAVTATSRRNSARNSLSSLEWSEWSKRFADM